MGRTAFDLNVPACILWEMMWSRSQNYYVVNNDNIDANRDLLISNDY